ncbi:unnamed protein product [Trichobilharzia szidati]|nr:unnamed protein product [Trichobilharzia szidati]
MEKRITSSISDHELVSDERVANRITNSNHINSSSNNSSRNSITTDSRKHQSFIGHSQSVQSDQCTDFYANYHQNTNPTTTTASNTSNNNTNWNLPRRCRTQSFKPRMVARSSVNSKHQLTGNIRANLSNYPSDQRLCQSNQLVTTVDTLSGRISPYNHHHQETEEEIISNLYITKNHTISSHHSSSGISNHSQNQLVDYMPIHSDRSPLAPSVFTSPKSTSTTTTSLITTPTFINMDSQMMTSPLSPEIMSNTPREPRIDDLMMKKSTNRTSSNTSGTTNTARYLEGTRNIQRRESKSYSSTISPIPLISYHQNAIPTGMDLYSTSMEKIASPERRLINDESGILRKLHHKGDLSKQTVMSKARVELVLIFVKVGQVDTVNERYQADIFLQARWREPLLDAIWNKSSHKSKSGWQSNQTVENPMTELTPKRHLNTLKLQDDEFWNPRLLIDNAQGEPIEIVSHEVEFVEPDFEAYLVEKRRIKGVFHETLELRHFPFDCQDLSVTITCDRTIDEVELVASPTEVSQVDVRCAEDSQEWKIFHHVDIKSMEIQTGYSPGTSKRRHPGLVFTSRSARRSGYFMVNMVLISCVLCLLSFAAFSVPANENRLQLSLLLLLTTVTFKFAASQNLPKISYLTYLDKVVLVNFFMLVILTVWHAIARAVSASKPKFLEYEHYVMYSLLSCYCLGSVFFGLTVYLDVSYSTLFILYL